MYKDLTRREALATLAFASVTSNISFAQGAKKRIVILIDGTSNDEADRTEKDEYIRGATNVALLDKPRKAIAPLIMPVTSDGIIQKVIYHRGPEKAATGLDLMIIVREVYGRLVTEFDNGDEIYLFGFSRGAYGVRALAGMINVLGIQKRQSSVPFETMWKSYERKSNSAVKESDVHESREIACVGLWDTVSSFGVPGGFGLEIIGNLFSDHLLEGIHDTRLPPNVKVALHAVAVDERRRSFIPMFWTAPGGIKPDSARFVEQAWFPGVHCNVGGGYRDSGLSDLALIWMIARVQEWTDLKFDLNNVRKETEDDANIDGRVYNSSTDIYVASNIYNYIEGVFHPPGRRMLYKENNENNINEVVHWSVKVKYGRPCKIGGEENVAYRPPYFHAETAEIIRPSDKELELVPPRVRELLTPL
jgi:hypothetical protein